LGPIHSLHDPDGRLVDESPWIEDDYVGALVTFNLVPDWEYVEEYEHFVWQELSRIPYRQDLEASIRRYARALDVCASVGVARSTDRDPSPQGGHRTGLTNGQGRAQGLPSPDSQALEPVRNRTVHAGHETRAVDSLLQQLRFCTEKLIEFHLSAVPAFMSIDDAVDFLDTATEMDVMRRMSEI